MASGRKRRRFSRTARLARARMAEEVTLPVRRSGSDPDAIQFTPRPSPPQRSRSEPARRAPWERVLAEGP